MPYWTIRTRDNEGNIENIGVQALTANVAIRLAEVDPEHVEEIKKQPGDWDPWHQQVSDNVRAFAFAGVAIYVMWIYLVLPDSWISFSELGIVGYVFFGAIGLVLCVALVPLLLNSLIGLFRHRKGETSEAKVIVRATIENTAMHQLHKLMSLCLSVGAVGCAIYVVLLFRGDDPVKPYLIVLPLLVVHMGSHRYEQ